MVAYIRNQGNIDTGTGDAEPQRQQTVTDESHKEGPTGESEPTRQQTVTDETHEEGPTGAAESVRPETVEADWPKGKQVQSAENKAVQGEDLESKTKDELYELATEADIDGRSTMNKDELINALRGES